MVRLCMNFRSLRDNTDVLVSALDYKNYINTRMCCCVAIRLVIIIEIKCKNYDVRSWSN